jgi:hypothetical protein
MAGEDDTAGLAAVSAQLRRVRTESRPHWVALVAGVVVGLVLAGVHWLGLVVGGALVGLVAASLRRAVLAGLGFGLVVAAVWALLLALPGALGDVVAMGQIAGLGLLVALVAPVLGSLARGIV